MTADQMNRFAQCLKFVLKWEGGYSDHPSDRGGATNQGITQATYDSWRIGRSLGRQPVSGLSGDERNAIYRERYWDRCRCNWLPRPADLVMFDTAVNCGSAQATKWLQRAVKVKADGVIGPITLEAVSKCDPNALASEIIANRLDLYDSLIERDPKQAVFAKGWSNRVEDLRKELANG